MRSKKALYNILFTVLLQLVTVVCGFIAPRLILTAFGSDVNGMISSIVQFLGYIVLLEAGVGGVIRAALYKPLAQNDHEKLSGIIMATEKFFKKVAYIFTIYLFLVAIFYPLIIESHYSWVYTFSLVLIIGISTIVQYFFSITYHVLLQSDQRMYFTSSLQILTVLVNTLLIVIFIKLGAGIHLVKLCSAIVFIIRPIILSIFVKKKYQLNRRADPDYNAIKQRWSGLGQHIAYFIHTNTDMVVLTLLTGIREVSVYSIYLMVVTGIGNLISAVSNGLSATIGDMIVKEESEKLKRTFDLFEFSIFSLTTFFYTATAFLIVPFVSVYTKGIDDVNYLRPVFGYLLVAAHAIFCIRNPYSTVIYAAGHFKETNRGAYIEAALNIILSIILVAKYGLIGVAIGTLIAMLYRTIEMAVYLTKNIMFRDISLFVKRCLISILIVILTICVEEFIPPMKNATYSAWIIYAIEVAVVSLVTTIIVSVFAYKKECIQLLSIFKKKFLIKKY